MTLRGLAFIALVPFLAAAGVAQVVPGTGPAKPQDPAAAANAPAAATNAPASDTNAPAATNLPVAVEAPAPEWVGFVRVLRNEKGDPRAIRLVADGKLLAVDLDEKGLALAKVPKSKRVRVKGTMEDRDGRTMLVVTEFTDAAESVPAPAPAPEPPPAAAPSAASASTNAPAPAPTNAPPAP